MKRLLLIVCFIVSQSVASAAYAQGASVLDIKRVTSEGGITAWLVEDHSVPVIAMNFGFKGAGSILDGKDKQGLARMLSNTLDEGAGDLDSQAFQKTLRDLSISLGFSANRDDFSGGVKTLSKNKQRAFELTKLALTQPRFDEEAIDRMRIANQSRIRVALSDPDWIAARLLNDTAFAGHPYALNSGGTLSSLEKIKADDLRMFHKNYIGKNNLVVSVAGDITAEELKGVLDDIFGALPEVEIPEQPALELQNQGKVFVYQRDIPQTIVEIVQPGIGRHDPEYQTAQVLNFILGSSGFGSRLTKEIREKRGLTYGIYSYFHELEYAKILSISTSTQNEKVPEMLTLIGEEFQKMKSGSVSAKELELAQSNLIGALPLSLTSTDKISSLLTSLQLDNQPIDYLDQREAKIKATTIEDVQNLAQKLLDPAVFTTVLVGQPADLKGAGFNAVETLKTIPNVE